MPRLPEYDQKVEYDDKGNFLRFKSDSERQYHWITNAPIKTYEQVKQYMKEQDFPKRVSHFVLGQEYTRGITEPMVLITGLVSFADLCHLVLT